MWYSCLGSFKYKKRQLVGCDEEMRSPERERENSFANKNEKKNREGDEESINRKKREEDEK